MRSWFKATAGALVVATITGLSAMADATTALFLGREELVRISDVVVRVKVGKATVRESDDKATILTRTDIEVTQCLKGPCSARFVVEQFGGTYNGKTQRVLGDGRLVPGEDAVVFLKKGDNGTAYLTVLAQSVYPTQKEWLGGRWMGSRWCSARVTG